MEHELRCNNLSCRALLSSTGQTDSNAIVTTCSHIFCVTCAETIFTDARLCPACDSSLPDSDDIVYTSLNPPQTFRTTILAGLSPMIIQDICERALGFWTYQVTQEIRLQETVLKEAKERTAQMEKQVANIVREANSEIALMSDKIQGKLNKARDSYKNQLDSDRFLDLKMELEQSTRKNRELAETNRQNMKEYTKLKMQYEKVMSKSTIAASYGKANGIGNAAMLQGQGLYDGGMRQAVLAGANGGNSRIGATPSRAFQPQPVQPSIRRNTTHQAPTNDTLRPVNIVNNTNNNATQSAGQNYGSRSNVSKASTGSGRQGINGHNGLVQKHGSSYAVEGVAYLPNHGNQHQQQVLGRRSTSTLVGHEPQPAGKFRISLPSNNGASRMGRPM